eukprot:XP_014778363.1 PREDICTED: putative uncharacterized protein DDB_G0272516 [Octopus bimaculoides]
MKEINVILEAKKSVIGFDNKLWVRKDTPNSFDITMRAPDSAQKAGFKQKIKYLDPNAHTSSPNNRNSLTNTINTNPTSYITTNYTNNKNGIGNSNKSNTNMNNTKAHTQTTNNNKNNHNTNTDKGIINNFNNINITDNTKYTDKPQNNISYKNNTINLHIGMNKTKTPQNQYEPC